MDPATAAPSPSASVTTREELFRMLRVLKQQLDQEKLAHAAARRQHEDARLECEALRKSRAHGDGVEQEQARREVLLTRLESLSVERDSLQARLGEEIESGKKSSTDADGRIGSLQAELARARAEAQREQQGLAARTSEAQAAAEASRAELADARSEAAVLRADLERFQAAHTVEAAVQTAGEERALAEAAARATLLSGELEQGRAALERAETDNGQLRARVAGALAALARAEAQLQQQQQLLQQQHAESAAALEAAGGRAAAEELARSQERALVASQAALAESRQVSDELRSQVEAERREKAGLAGELRASHAQLEAKAAEVAAVARQRDAAAGRAADEAALRKKAEGRLLEAREQAQRAEREAGEAAAEALAAREQARALLRGEASAWAAVPDAHDPVPAHLGFDSPVIQQVLRAGIKERASLDFFNQWAQRILAGQDVAAKGFQRGVEIPNLPPAALDGLLALVVPMLRARPGVVLAVQQRTRCEDVRYDVRLKVSPAGAQPSEGEGGGDAV